MSHRTSPSDVTLVSRSRDGDGDAFRMLIEKYRDQIAATVTGMLGPVDEVEDVCQETFIRFYQALDRFRGDSAVATYLTRIAINLSLNAIKRRKRQGRRFQVLDGVELPDETGSATEDVQARQEASALVHGALQRLPEKFRAVVVLRMIDGYSTRETADVLKIPVGTVLSRLSRGQEQLRRELEPYMMHVPSNDEDE